MIHHLIHLKSAARYDMQWKRMYNTRSLIEVETYFRSLWICTRSCCLLKAQLFECLVNKLVTNISFSCMIQSQSGLTNDYRVRKGNSKQRKRVGALAKDIGRPTCSARLCTDTEAPSEVTLVPIRASKLANWGLALRISSGTKTGSCSICFLGCCCVSIVVWLVSCSLVFAGKTNKPTGRHQPLSCNENTVSLSFSRHVFICLLRV